MPHATGEEDDDATIGQLLGGLNNFDTDNAGGEDQFTQLLGGDWQNRDLDADQEKAEGHLIDEDDLDDDDLAALPDEEAVIPSTEPLPGLKSELTNELFEGGAGDDDLDALFGEDQDGQPASGEPIVKQEQDVDKDLFGEDEEEPIDVPPATHTFGDIKKAGEQQQQEEEEDSSEVRLQRYLFEQARLRGAAGQTGPLPRTAGTGAASDNDFLSLVYPSFEPGVAPKFGELFPQRQAFYQGKTPLKPPKPVQITKASLDIEQDQEKSFRLPGPASSHYAARLAEAEVKGLILLADLAKEQAEEEDDLDFDTLEDDMDDIGGVRWQDLVTLCQDWNIPGDVVSDDELVTLEPEEQGSDMDEMDALFGGADADNDFPIDRPAKRRKVAHPTITPLYSTHNVNSMVDDPEAAVSKLARRLQLDLNDPYILLDEEKVSSAKPKRKLGGAFRRDAVGGLTKDFTRRYNISNDEAYEALKANQQNKVRSTLQNVEIQHSMPAVKLQYPFYKLRLTPKEARAFHRPALHGVAGNIHFEKNKHIKRKNLKGLDTQAIFARAADLSAADNSSLLLLEYSEEHPAMLSNFGMGSKIINYYRRKDNEDTARPKGEIGETQVLMPEDKSPFAIFGDVDRGQSMPTLLNAMYRAPIFQHKSNSRDFIVVKTHTHTDGNNFYLRNVENLHVVGQEFPLVEVPGTHSRKVTDANKKRLRMLSYRMFRKYGKVKNEMILDHLPGSDIAQNRSKMREFMDYDKDRGWLPRRTEILPEEAEIRSMIKPEDICLLYSTQVGDRHLQDAGYNKDEDDEEVEAEDDDDTNNLDKQLAPWQTTKNFLSACQGKAMLQLHGEGDPSGRGEAFSFIRTSMKGGFKEIGGSIEDRLNDMSKKKGVGGHSYNVAQQQKAYNDAIRRIWDAQQRSLTSTVEHDVDMGGVED